MTRILSALVGVMLLAASAAAQPVGIGINPATIAGPVVAFPSSPLMVSGGPQITNQGTQINIKAPDGGAYLIEANGIVAFNSTQVSLYTGGSGVMAISTTASTVTSAGTTPAMAGVNGSLTFRINVGTGGTATTIVAGMAAASNGWNCTAENITGNAANRADARMAFQASTTTSATMQYQTVSTGVAKAFTASDIVSFLCAAF